MEPRLDLASRIDLTDPVTLDVTCATMRVLDGSPVTATDVAGTYMTVLDPRSTSGSHKMLSDRMYSVEAVNPHLARFHLKAPLATYRTDFDFGIVSFHDGPPRSDRVIGSGPFVLRALTDEHAVLERNPYYAGTPVQLARLEIKFVRDAAARLLMLTGGSADLIQNAMRLDLVPAMRSQPGCGWRPRRAPS